MQLPLYILQSQQYMIIAFYNFMCFKEDKRRNEKMYLFIEYFVFTTYLALGTLFISPCQFKLMSDVIFLKLEGLPLVFVVRQVC